ncbi:MAG: energy-coupling factor transporter transmembrane protein EcfT [Methanomicrobiales archaeon]|nr:energy-coupling factor transporter transmembrane protein EcfT [Methanomicrobiales archaeon]
MTPFRRRMRGRPGSPLVFVSAESFLHRLHPLTKLLILVLYTAAALAFEQIVPGLLLLGFVFTAAGASGMIRPFLRGYRTIIPFIFLVVVTDAFFAGPLTGTVFLSIPVGSFALRLVEGRVLFAISMGVRLLTLSGVCILFILSTSYTAFVRALRSAGFSDAIAFSLGTALRTISFLSEDMSNIMDAQRARGMEFDRNLLLRNRNKLTAVTVPMAVTVLRRSRSLTAAMESRGFGASSRASVYHRPRFTISDVAMFIAILIVIGIAWVSSFAIVI